MIACAFCGRQNGADSRYCIDCGKPLDSPGVTATATPAAGRSRSGAHRRLSPAMGRRTSAEVAPVMPPTRVHSTGATTVNCGWCGNSIENGLPFCPHCGRRTDAKLSAAAACRTCGGAVRPEHDAFCATCGTPLKVEEKPEFESKTLVFSAKRRDLGGARLAVLDESGATKQVVPIEKPELTLGRTGCDLSFADDAYLSPLHAQFSVRDGAVYVRDLGSRNRTWVFIDEPYALADDDVLLLGSQLLHFQRLGSPSPSAMDADGTRRIGSLVPTPDIARLAQLRADGSVRDVQHLSQGRTLRLGRDTGDWTFPYDQTMSGRHAEIRESTGQFVVHDLGSRNGIAVAVRGERKLEPGQRVLAGDQVIRVESV